MKRTGLRRGFFYFPSIESFWLKPKAILDKPKHNNRKKKIIQLRKKSE